VVVWQTPPSSNASTEFGHFLNEFEPTTDFPESVDADDTLVVSSAKARDVEVQNRRRTILAGVAITVTIVLVIMGYGVIRVAIAVAAAYLILRMGFAIIGAFARPIPEPPPPGELRRVKLTYRCSSCGAELRMTLANDQVPQAPRHCADEMELTTAVEDL
jgi:hypothetical protein